MAGSRVLVALGAVAGAAVALGAAFVLAWDLIGDEESWQPTR